MDPSAMVAARNRRKVPDGGLREFSDRHFLDLQRLLAQAPTKDAYAKSALYYALTGRGKVWLISGKIVCTNHPNRGDGELLVFFPFAEDHDQLRQQITVLADHEAFLSKFNRVSLARIPEDICAALFLNGMGPRSEMYLHGCFRLNRVEEDSLDWIFPSYDISLPLLSTAVGPRLAGFRNKVRKFDRADVEIIRLNKLDACCVSQAILEVAASWAQARLRKNGVAEPGNEQVLELLSPYIRIANLDYDICQSMDGLFLHRGGEFIGFALWEWPARRRGTVAAVAALTKSYERGFSEYLQFVVAEKLSCHGYERMCIGGSETAGLDRFKRKLDPVETHRLCTVKLSIV